MARGQKVDGGEPSIQHIPHGSIITIDDIKRLQLIRDQTQSNPVDDFINNDDCYQPSCYDLRIGRQYIKFEENSLEVTKKKNNEFIEIPPFGAVILSTYEIVATPQNVVGRFNVRFKAALKGIIVQMGTQVEPNYTGYLFAIVQNITANPIKLQVAVDRFFTIEFHYTSVPCNGKKNEIYDFRKIEKFIEFKSTFSHFVKSINKLAEDAKHNSEKAAHASETAKSASVRAEEASKEASAATKSNRKALYVSVLLVVVVPVFWSIAMPIAVEKWYHSADFKAKVATYEKSVDGFKSQLDGVKSLIEGHKAASDATKTVADSYKDRIDLIDKQVSRIEADLLAGRDDLPPRHVIANSKAMRDKINLQEAQILALQKELSELKSLLQKQPGAVAPRNAGKRP